MDVVFMNCAGLDVHKKSIDACVLLSSPEGLQGHIKTFTNVLEGLQAVGAWLTGFGVTHVAIDSTGAYWKPVFDVLSADFDVWIVNARRLKHVPGRKTDATDAEWLAQLMRVGLLKRSFISG